MTRTIYLHVGPTKTGTSAIQSVMSRHDDSVLIYPKVGMTKLGSHHELVYSLRGRSGRRHGPGAGTTAASAEKLLREIAVCALSARRAMLFSSEVLTGPVGGRNARQSVAAFVDAITACMPDKKFEVEVLFACRDHFERAASAYSQRLKGGYSTEKRSPDEFLFHYIDGLQYAPLGRELRQTGFKVMALNYHPSRTFVSRFLAHVGFPTDQIPHTDTRNMSLSTKALIAKLAANTSLTEESDRLVFSKALRKMPDYNAPSRFIFGGHVAAEAEIRFAADRLSLEQEFGLQLPNPQVTTRTNMFFLNRDQLSDIADTAKSLGEKSGAIVEAAARYLHDS